MADQPDEVLKQARRSTLPPLFAPRSSRPITPTSTGTAAPPRRRSLLFTPPNVTVQSRPDTPAPEPTPGPAPVESIAAPSLPAEVIEVPQAPPAAESSSAVPEEPTPSAPVDGLGIEQFEHEPISLNATGQHVTIQDQHTLSPSANDEPREAGFEIERSDFTIDVPADATRLEVESFWTGALLPEAKAPVAEPEEASPSVPETDEPVEHENGFAESDDVLASEPEPALEAPAAFVARAEPALEAPAAFVAQPEPALETPGDVASDAPVVPAWSAPIDDAEAALEDAFAEPALPDRPPRWATPHGVEVVASSEPAAPAEASEVAAPTDELSDALAWPSGATAADAELDAMGSDIDVSRELSASAAVWRAAQAARSAMPDAVAAALERIAQRVRAGEVPLPGDVALAGSDESALAVALAALLRGGANA